MQPASWNTRWKHHCDLALRLSDVKKAPVHIRVPHRRVMTNGIDKFPVFAKEWQLRGPPHAHAQMHSVKQEDRGQHSRQAQTPQTLPRPASQESAAAAIAIDGNVIILETSSDGMREAAVGGADSRRQRKGNVELFQATLPLGSPSTRSKARTNKATR